MKYVSTRGAAPALAFDDVLLTGLARDGGLYLPQSWPEFSPAELRRMAGLDYADLAHAVLRPLVGAAIAESDLRRICRETYAGFGHCAVAPLVQLDARTWLMELFHGPTLAFKDYAMQLLGRLFDHVLTRRGERLTVAVATSGDTGPAAIEACRDRHRLDIFVLFPDGRVSEVQRRQMTTVVADNVHSLAIRGSFDDCQDLLKAMFNDAAFRDEVRLSAMNSINWARVAAQIVYYFAAGLALGAPDRPIGFSVPTGNFGNVYAGYAAGRMGLPVSQLVVGSNSNDILTRFFDSGHMTISEVVPTLSPSMDIQVSSNFERLLYDLCDGDGAEVGRIMTEFRRGGSFGLPADRVQRARRLFDGFRLDDSGTLAEMARVRNDCGRLIDPHTAIGVAAARVRRRDDVSAMVVLATAHPAKFPDAVARASGLRPELPARLADLYERPEQYVTLANDLGAVEGFLRARLGDGQTAATATGAMT